MITLKEWDNLLQYFQQGFFKEDMAVSELSLSWDSYG